MSKPICSLPTMAKVGGPCAHCKATESSRWQNGDAVRSPARFVGKPCCMRRQCAIAFGFRDPANDKKYKSGKKAEVDMNYILRV